MNRDEILELSRLDNAQGDERDGLVRMNSGIAGFIASFVLAVLLAQYKSLALDQPIQDLMAVAWAGMAAVFFYRFAKTRQRSDLLIGLLWGIVALVLAVSFVCSTQGAAF